MRIALVFSSGPVLDPTPPAVAVVATTAELGIEGFEGFGVDLADLQVTERRSDVLADVDLIPALGVRGGIE